LPEFYLLYVTVTTD